MMKTAFLLLSGLAFSSVAAAADGSHIEHPTSQTMLQDGVMKMQDMPMDGMGDHHEAEAEPATAIAQILKIMFETPEKPLQLAPIVWRDGWAVAGWQQAGRGGRVLLRHSHHGWRLHALGGNGFTEPSGLVKAGMPTTTAEALASQIVTSEAALDPGQTRFLEGFDGTIVLNDDSSAQAGHGAHEGHAP